MSVAIEADQMAFQLYKGGILTQERAMIGQDGTPQKDSQEANVLLKMSGKKDTETIFLAFVKAGF